MRWRTCFRGGPDNDACAPDSRLRPAVRERLTHPGVGGGCELAALHLSACVYVAWVVGLSGGLWSRAGGIAVTCMLLGV